MCRFTAYASTRIRTILILAASTLIAMPCPWSSSFKQYHDTGDCHGLHGYVDTSCQPGPSRNPYRNQSIPQSKTTDHSTTNYTLQVVSKGCMSS
ncbi:hypothetical protein BDV24DRAFT_127494 [Aspergillus arachidicola]|uniref:Secreted protein n=1 Tax=Aspergillus arachidicola TaxID=656916 RepID=A0A5N6YFY6_9EURO|nr:hypothetical protein BDV24DRAFT_127494 [Aspergillus arachidicola]